METSIRRGLPRAVVDDVFLAPVHINAGGTHYTTTLDTLTRYPESKLAKLFDGTLPIPIDPISRQYFLDINGSVFVHVLDFLRYGELLLPEGFTQLPLLTKLADYFEIQEMVQVIMKFENKEEIKNKKGNVEKPQKINENRTQSVSHENFQNSLEPEKKENVAETNSGNLNIGICELGIVKLGVLQGAKVDFGIMESATMKGEKFESQTLTAKETQTEKLVAGNIESDALVAKSSMVEVLETEQMNCNIVEMKKVKAGNVEMQTIDAGLTKMEMLEAKTLKTETVEMGTVNAATVEVKSLESETLKLKTLEVETLTANICKQPNKQSVKLHKAKVNSEIALVYLVDQHIMVFTNDQKIISSISEDIYVHQNYLEFSECIVIRSKGNNIRYNNVTHKHHEDYLLKVFQVLVNNDYKLASMAGQKINSDDEIHIFQREYLFFKL